MEILEFAAIHINFSQKRTKYGCALLIFMVLGSQLWDVWTNEAHYLVLLPCQLMSLVTVLLWIGSAPSFYALTQELGSLFEEESYQILVQKHQQWIKQWIVQGERKYLKLWKIGYCLGWSLCWVYVIMMLFRYQMIPGGFLGWSMGILLVAAVVLNCSSYYTCVVYAYFLYRVSLLKDLRYNRYIPSATEGYRRLSWGAHRGSTVFLIVSSLVTFSGAILMYTAPKNWGAAPLNRLDIFLLCLMVMLVITLGFGTFTVLFLLPKIMLRNLVRFWQDNSLRQFQNALFLAEEQKDEEKVDRISQRIHELIADNVGLRFSFTEILVALTTIMVNAFTLINFVIGMLE